MGFGEGFAKGFGKTLSDSVSGGKSNSGASAKKGTGTGNLSSEIRNGVAKIFPGGISGRRKVSQAGAAKEYPGLDTGGYGDE